MEKDQYVFGKNSLLAKSAKIAACYNTDIAKSEIGYAFSNSNPDMNSLKFPKKGSVLIKMISDKKDILQAQYNEMVLAQTGFKTQLTESGIITFSNRNGYEEANYDYNSTPQDIRDVCYSYNDFRYNLKRQMEEIKTCQALIDNLEENKTYNLSTPQILSLQKAMEFDLMKSSENNIEKGGSGSGRKLVVGKKYKTDSGMGGSFTVKYHGKKEDGKHEFENVTNKDFKGVKYNVKHEDVDKWVTGDNIFKSEGSRGGKVIGHTKSGKPIYDSGNNEHMIARHKNFSIKDHVEAADFHDQKAKKEGDGKKRMHYRTEEQFHIHAARDKGAKNKDLPEDWHSQDEKHKVGDHVIDSEGKKGKVTHADDKEVAVEHENGDVSGYEHYQVKKFTDKKENFDLEGELNKQKPTGKEREVAAKDDEERARKDTENKEAKKDIKKSSEEDLNKAFEELGL